MGKLFEQIRSAVANDRFFVAWHADERCEERGITAWQLVAGLEEAELVREHPGANQILPWWSGKSLRTGVRSK